MIGFVIFRSYEQEPHGDLARFMWTERTAAVASADGTAAALSIEPQVNYTPDKYFLVYNVVRVPESGELQLTVAYNLNRLGREARESGEDSSVYLSEDELPFIFILYDSDGNIYDEFDYLLQVKHFHGFARLAFSGIPEQADGLSLAVFRREDAERIGTSVIGNGDGALVPWQELVILSDSAAVEDYEFDKDELYSGQPAAGLSGGCGGGKARSPQRSCRKRKRTARRHDPGRNRNGGCTARRGNHGGRSGVSRTTRSAYSPLCPSRTRRYGNLSGAAICGGRALSARARSHIIKPQHRERSSLGSTVEYK